MELLIAEAQRLSGAAQRDGIGLTELLGFNAKGVQRQ